MNSGHVYIDQPNTPLPNPSVNMKQIRERGMWNIHQREKADTDFENGINHNDLENFWQTFLLALADLVKV